MQNILMLLPQPRAPKRTLFEEVPELNTIWTPELSATAALHTKSWEDHDSRTESGEVLVAYVNGQPVGGTGWYLMGDNEAGLRWHGVLPPHRRKGYSRIMIELACKRLPSSIRKVYECTRNPKSIAAFRACGFEVLTDPEIMAQARQHAEYDLEGTGQVLCKRLY